MLKKYQHSLHNIYHSPYTNNLHNNTGEETMFKIKKSTKMSKVFKAYASRKGVEEGSLRFLLDGERISETDTPKMLELEDEKDVESRQLSESLVSANSCNSLAYLIFSSWYCVVCNT